MGHICVTQSDTFRYARLRYLAFFGDGDGGRDDSAAGPSRLGYYKHQSKRNMCHARLTCTCIYDAHALSAHWCKAKMCCVFLVSILK